MSIKPDALQWLVIHHNVNNGAIYASKIYTPNHSRTGRNAWWLEIPMNRIEPRDAADIHLLCQVAPNELEFHYLRVPAAYFREQLARLIVRDNNKVSLFLSAEPENMFVDERSVGGVAFGNFLYGAL